MTDEILEKIREKLPTQPSTALQVWMRDNEEGLEEELGGHALIYWRESVEIGPEYGQTETYEQQTDRERKTRRTWAARCLCTVCENEMYVGWESGGIRVYDNYEGGFYTGVPGADEGEVNTYWDGEKLMCPWCGTYLTVRRKAGLRNGRTQRMMVQEIIDVEADGIRYGVVMAWLRERFIDATGVVDDIYPVEAVIVDTDRKLYRLSSHGYDFCGRIGRHNAWHRVKRVVDPSEMLYYSWEAINNTKIGSMEAAPVNKGELAGTTAEKAGLEELLENGLSGVVNYLKLWSRYPNVENLVKAGWEWTVAETVENGKKLTWADLREASPAKMLGMTRAEVRELSKNKWRISLATEWSKYRTTKGAVSATEFKQYAGRMGVELIQKATERGFKPDRICRYLEKQEAGGQYLLDNWRMAEQLGLDMTSSEILFPQRLRETHNRLEREIDIRKSKKEREKYDEGFRKIVNKYGYLEWSDGELCIRLPQDYEELVREGAVLRHCVGGYADAHTCEKDVIFFVRHARRPERSYYTLDIRMNDGEPHEVQLHGYGNERHGENKQYKHSIPKRVREFCDRWEREILLPRWKKAQKRKENAA